MLNTSININMGIVERENVFCCYCVEIIPDIALFRIKEPRTNLDGFSFIRLEFIRKPFNGAVTQKVKIQLGKKD